MTQFLRTAGGESSFAPPFQPLLPSPVGSPSYAVIASLGEPMSCRDVSLPLALLVSLAFSACAGAAPTPGAMGPSTSRRVLLADEIRAVSATDAYEVVQRLRPEWLRRRGQTSLRNPSAGEVVVYLDGVRYGGPRSLEGVRAESVVQMEYLDASDATTRFGTGHGGGAILVRTR